MPNTALLEQTMQFIKDNPQSHDQTEWCGTSRCFAGWMTHFAGWQQWVGAYRATVVKDGLAATVSLAARREAGLTDWEAEQLFDARNTVEDLELMVKDVIDGNLRSGYRYRGERLGWSPALIDRAIRREEMS